eukprot:GHUV01023255.1.p1 GENE.GHUV01023255.1~~GHUV01023255.1.p1  ORF type:complete len:291 (+),score=55.39 GHUV01023255.1:158-1030(+)
MEKCRGAAKVIACQCPGGPEQLEWLTLACRAPDIHRSMFCAQVVMHKVQIKLAWQCKSVHADDAHQPIGDAETTTALLHLPLQLFKACESLGGCIIFLDELDSLATSRDRSDMHEASRRLLGVLLREIDGFDNTLGSDTSAGGPTTTGVSTKGSGSSRRSVLIGATNRRQDLDAALLSRFDVSIHFGLPDEQCRAAILQQYANHLNSQELSRIAEKTAGFSGRDLRDICEQTERQWASRIIRGEVDAEHLPGIGDYLANVRQRKEGAGASSRGGGYPWMSVPGMPGQYRT